MSKIKDRMAKVKRKLSEKSFKSAPELDPHTKAALEIGFAYEKVLGEYIHKPALRYFTKLGTEGIKPITLGHLKKAATILIKNKVDAETYVRAQFYWFHIWFKRAPKIHELSSVRRKGCDAPWRLREYLKEKRPKSYSSVMPKEEITKENLDKINQKRLNQLVDAWDKSPEEIMVLFHSSGVFDQQWVVQNKIYLGLKKAGKI